MSYPRAIKGQVTSGALQVFINLVTDRQTDTQTDKKAKTEAALSGLSEFLTSAHHQGAVQ